MSVADDNTIPHGLHDLPAPRCMPVIQESESGLPDYGIALIISEIRILPAHTPLPEVQDSLTDTQIHNIPL